MVCPFTQATPPTMTFIFPSVNLDSPLFLYSIPVIWFTGFFPHTLKVSIELPQNTLLVLMKKLVSHNRQNRRL